MTNVEQDYKNYTDSAEALGLNESISTKAHLVGLNISSWAGRKTDKKASSEVNAVKNAEKDTASVRKKLLGTCEDLASIHTLIGQIRNHNHYRLTMPWSDSGIRLLTEAARPIYEKTMDALITDFYVRVNTFISSYQWEVVQAQLKLGDLFDPSEYPSAESLRSKFSISYNIAPLPESGDFRVDCAKEDKERLQAKYIEFTTMQVDKALSDIWERLYKSLSNLSERLDYGSHEKKKIFKEGSVNAVVDMIDILDICNVQNDPVMTQLKEDLKRAMNGITSEALREDDTLRLETKRKLDAAIKALPSLK
tara:strand:+ start:1205 stop:2128 length:924 start_codon:yes stop_codon:yes gene_type:complete